jgi:hypothetical protein
MARAARIPCLLATLALACASESGPSDTSPDASAGVDPSWRQVFADLPGALISVWGRSDHDVWSVGSDTRDGRGALILHYDGTAWERRVLGLAHDLWWVNGLASGPIFMSGSEGVIVRVDGERYEVMATPPTLGIAYGVWAASATDVWAVGGDPLHGTGSFVWRYDGSVWAVVDVPTPTDVGAYYKVWGTRPDDVWIAGLQGTLLHFDGALWSMVDAGLSDPLFTVNTRPGGHTVAVGGFDLGVMLERPKDAAWSVVALPPGTRQLFGVWLADERGYAVGADATILEGGDGAWSPVTTGLPTDKTLHAVWVDDAAGVWAVGGDVFVPPLGAGVMVHHGTTVSTTITDVSLTATVQDAGLVAEGGAPGPRDAGDGGSEEGGPDATVDAPPPPPPLEPGEIECGGQICPVGVHQCCFDQADVLPPQCIDASATCPAGFYSAGCDQADDCAAGEVCCLEVFFQGGGISAISCKTTCFTNELCSTSDECAGSTCVPLSFLSRYRECL